MAQDKERSKQRKTQDSDQSSTRFAAADGEGVSSFYARAQQRRAGREGQGGSRAPSAGRAEGGMPSASMDDIARGYGVDRNSFYGSRSRETMGLETDQSFANRAEPMSPNFGDNLGAGPGYGEERGSDLGPGIGANRAYGYGAVPTFGASSARGSASTVGYGVGYGTPGYGEHPTLRGRPASERSRAEQHRGASSRTQQHRRSQEGDTRGGWRTEGDYPEASFEHQRYTDERARASDQPFDRGSIWGTVNLPPTGSPSDASLHTDREPRHSRWRREPLEARDIMTRDVRSVHPDTNLRDAARIMRDQNTGIVPVVNADDVLQGVITDRDIVIRSVAEGKNAAQLTAADVMTYDIDAATPDESLVDVVHLMGTKQVRRVPVVDQSDRLVGIISMADVATRADYDTELQDALEEISLRRSFWRE